MNELTPSFRKLWVQTPCGTWFECHKHVPQNERQIEQKTFCKISRRHKQPKRINRFNASQEWASYYEMFQRDAEWNPTMTVAGWSVDNLHVLAELIKLAVKDHIRQQLEGRALFGRQWEVTADWAAVAADMLDADHALNGAR